VTLVAAESSAVLVVEGVSRIWVCPVNCGADGLIRTL